jgi:hypothetical protein
VAAYGRRTSDLFAALPEDVAERGEWFGDCSLVGPAAASLALDEPCLMEHLQVMAHSGLTECERLGQVADARLAVRLCLDEAEQAFGESGLAGL